MEAVLIMYIRYVTTGTWDDYCHGSHYDDWHRTCNDHCYGRCNVHWHGGCADNMHRSRDVVSWRGQHDRITPMSRHFTFKGRVMFKSIGGMAKSGQLKMHAEVEEESGKKG